MLTAAIVLFHNDKDVLSQAVNSFLEVPMEKRLYLIDNSKTDYLKEKYIDPEITYIHTGQNLGFGKGHNLILKELSKNSNYHLILNPDAYFSPEVVPTLVDCLKNDPSIGIIAPKILYPDGTFQKSIRRFPKVQDFLIRRVPGFKYLFKKAFERANYLNRTMKSSIEAEAVSGCFQLFRTNIFLDVQGFDPRYFMYMEDIDICRKVHAIGYKVVYFPFVFVYHHSAYGSKKKFKLLWAHIKSIIEYFLKWSI